MERYGQGFIKPATNLLEIEASCSKLFVSDKYDYSLAIPLRI